MKVPYTNAIFRAVLLLSAALALTGCGSSEKSSVAEPTRWQRFLAVFSFDTDKTDMMQDRAPYTLRVKDYSAAFSFINGIDKAYYDSLAAIPGHTLLWDAPRDLKTIPYDSGDRSLSPDYKVFGWHPFWMNDAYQSYDYSLLSYVSWFSYDIDPATGSYGNASVISSLCAAAPEITEAAHAKDCKVLLTITNHSSQKIRQFLTNDAGQKEVLLDSVLHLVTTLDLDGLDLNFENTPSSYGGRMTDFVKDVSDRLKAVNPDYTLTLTLQKVNAGRIADIQSLNDYVDYFVLTGYDFYTSGSKRDGPVAPLTANEYNVRSLESVVDDYLAEGVLAEKLILALPYYGAVWTSTDPEPQSKNRQFKQHLTYRTLMAMYGDKGTPQYMPDSESAFFLNQTDSLNFEKIWFDDSVTLRIKFDRIKERKLAGLGIWALGYDNGRNELWRAIDNAYAVQNPQITVVETNAKFKIVAWLSDYEIPIVITVMFFSLFTGVGFFVSLFDRRVRNHLFENKSSRLIFILSVFGAIALIYIIALFLQNESVYSGKTTLFVTGLLIGALFTSVFTKMYNRHRERLP